MGALRVVALAFFGLLCAGCIPALAPPVRFSGGVGPVIPNPGDGQRFTGGGRIHIGVHPARFLPELNERYLDGSIGYAVNIMPDGDAHHGAYLEVFVFPWISKIDPSAGGIGSATRGLPALWRWEIGAFAKFAHSAILGAGGGGGIELRFSWSKFIQEDNYSSDRFIGFAWGEGGFGAGVLIEYYTLGPDDFLLFNFEINFDLPAFGGVVMFPEIIDEFW